MTTRLCSVEDCGKKEVARRMCSMHYARVRKFGEVGSAASSRGGTCSIPGCDSPHRSNGLCALHYGRQWRLGVTELPVRQRSSVWDRIMQKVVVDTGSGCLVWTGSCSGVGSYGQIRDDDGRIRYVHVISYEIHVGPVPEGFQVDHVRARGCVHTQCVLWEHLEAVPQLENFRRSTAPGAYTSRNGVCPRGHEQTPENVYTVPSTGAQQCHPCLKASRLAWYYRQKENSHA